MRQSRSRRSIRTVFCCLSWACLLLSASGLVCGQAKTAPQESGRPDVLILVFANASGQDQIGITYAGPAPRPQVMRDLQAFQSASGLTLQNIKITEGTAPSKPSKGKAASRMTGVECTAFHAVDPASRGLSVEPYAVAFRNYPHVLLTYFPGDGFSFQGLRSFDDTHVHIRLVQDGGSRSTVFTYQIIVHDPHFDKLGLPYLQPPADSHSVQDAGNAGSHRRLTMGIVALLALAAVGTGGIVYAVMARHVS